MKKFTLFVLLFTALSNCKFSENENPINVILILVDDMGHGDIPAHGNPLLKTPNLDKLFKESARFTNFAVSPTCSPTRAALLTGTHEFLVGVTHTREPMNHQDTNNSEYYRLTKPGMWELYNIDKDPYQDEDIAAENPNIVEKMGNRYEEWWLEVEQKMNDI